MALNGRVGQGVARALLGLVARQPHAHSVCDLGCGNGYLAGELGRRGHSVLGIDASATYLQIAREHNSSARVTFMHGVINTELANQLRATHPPFDLVVSSDVIEHLYDPLAFLRAAFAILRPGGTAIIGTPYHGYLKNLAISLTGNWDAHHTVHWHGGHIKFFSVASLTAMMRRAGFNEPAFTFYGRFPGFSKNMIAVATKPEDLAAR
jgi:2-polyprenyl-3-methyl-5-hydroxy-6-metoxy-1,4-benzoquinol methylase